MTPDAYRALVTEAEFQATVVEVAETLGWLTVHFRQMVGNPAGWPDLILIRNGRVLIVELKRERKLQPGVPMPLGPKQREWIERLGAAGADVRVWYPSMWDEIVAVLSERVAA